jgi:hypothetical protein
MSDEINVISRTQVIIVEPISGSVAVISEGPMGPTGLTGPTGPPGPKGDPGAGGAIAPYGLLAWARSNVNSAPVSTATETDVPGLTATYTAVTGRRYRVTVRASYSSTAASDVILTKLTNEVNTQVSMQRIFYPIANGGSYTACFVVNESPPAGVVNRKVRFLRESGTGTVTCIGGLWNELMIEDMGPDPNLIVVQTGEG